MRKTECGGGDDVDQLVEIERGARLFADGMEEHQLFDFLLGLLVRSRVLDDDAGLARKGREHLDVRLGEDEFLRGGIALQDPMISPLIFSGMEMLEVRRQIGPS